MSNVNGFLKSIMIRELVIIVAILTNGYIVKAQSINVSERNSTINSFLIQQVKKIDFSSGKVNVRNKSGIEHSYVLSSIRNINFNQLDIVSDINQSQFNSGKFYTSQVGSQLLVHYPFNQNSIVDFQILSIDGKLIMSKIYKLSVENNEILINISLIKKGIYVCRLRNDNSVKVIKFTKQ